MSLPLKVSFYLANGFIQKIELQNSTKISWTIQSQEKNYSLESQIDQWMKDYASGKQPKVNLPLNIGQFPEFTAKVYEVMAKIPFGSVISYGELADAVGHEGAARAVGNACGRNPWPLVIPCHRVVAASNRIGGFAFGSGMKTLLLNHEGHRY